jgi:hypothetical protein
MEDLVKEIDVNITNAGLSYDFPIPPREVGKAEYTTRTQDNPRQNEIIAYTRAGSLPSCKIVFYTTIPKEEEFVLIPGSGLSIKQAANITRKFIKNLPEGLIDADLGPGL